jgi:MFS family permease
VPPRRQVVGCHAHLQLNLANLTAGLLAALEPTKAGLTVALYSFVGFAGNFLGPLVFGWMLDRFGGAHSLLAWGFAYGSCGLAALVGGLAMLLVGRDSTTKAV